MSEWDQDYVDMEVPGHITFAASGQGHFQFGLVMGQMDWRQHGQRGEFTWAGSCESDEMNGRGHATLVGNELHGRLYIHLGDDTAFRAVRQARPAVGRHRALRV